MRVSNLDQVSLPVPIAPNRYEIKSFKVKLAVGTEPHNKVGVPLSERESVYELVRAIYAQLEPDQEHAVVLFVNTMGRVSGYRVIASGDFGQVPNPPSRILRDALLAGAQSIVLVHNHPNGMEKPSHSDVTTTQRIVVAAGALDVPVIDVLILAQGTGKIHSFDQNGELRRIMSPDALFRMMSPRVDPLRDSLQLLARLARLRGPKGVK